MPEEIENLANLQQIDLSYNEIKDLPIHLSLLTKIKKVDVSQNDFFVTFPLKDDRLISFFKDCNSDGSSILDTSIINAISETIFPCAVDDFIEK